MAQHKSILIIMAKAPIPGQVKTRLTPPLPSKDAAVLYDCFLQDILTEMGDLDHVDKAIAYTPASAIHFFKRYDSSGKYLIFPQTGEDLGTRMNNIFTDTFMKGYAAAVIIGSDLPDLPKSHVIEAFRRLHSQKSRVVLGPAADGGYYLIGMGEYHPELFENIAWSTGTVLSRTLHKAKRQGIETDLLPIQRDIDTFEDLVSFYHRYKNRNETDDQPGNKTMGYLLKMTAFPYNRM